VALATYMYVSTESSNSHVVFLTWLHNGTESVWLTSQRVDILIRTACVDEMNIPVHNDDANEIG